MVVIFLDIDGPLITFNFSSYEDIERKIKLLSDFYKDLGVDGVVIESTNKDVIDEKTLEVLNEHNVVKFIIDCFKKYGLNFLGITPNVKKILGESELDVCKEDEILLYLERHPEIEHYCVIDDDDARFIYKQSDLDKVRDHLVTVTYYSKLYPEEEGLLEKHREEIRQVLKLKR